MVPHQSHFSPQSVPSSTGYGPRLLVLPPVIPLLPHLYSTSVSLPQASLAPPHLLSISCFVSRPTSLHPSSLHSLCPPISIPLPPACPTTPLLSPSPPTPPLASPSLPPCLHQPQTSSLAWTTSPSGRMALQLASELMGPSGSSLAPILALQTSGRARTQASLLGMSLGTR